MPLTSMRDIDLGDALAQAIEMEKAFWVLHGRLGDSHRALTNLVCSLDRRWLGSPSEDRCHALAHVSSDPLEESYAALWELAQTRFPGPAEREAAFENYFARHRHLFVEGDPIGERLGVRDLREDPLEARALLERFAVPSEAASFRDQRVMQASRVKELETQVFSGLGRVWRGIFAHVLGLARRYAPTRKAGESAILGCRLVQQDIILEAGRRMAAQGLMAAPAEAFHLTHVQLSDWLAGREARDALVRTILKEKASERRWWRYSPPDRIEARAGIVADAADYSVDIRLTGQPISPGVATGTARLINTLGEATSIVPGEILLCHKPLFELTPLFDMAAAVVTETGNLLDHAGVLAREYGIPAVFGVKGLTEHIRNGDELRVDANRGVVERIQPEIDWLDY